MEAAECQRPPHASRPVAKYARKVARARSKFALMGPPHPSKAPAVQQTMAPAESAGAIARGNQEGLSRPWSFPNP